MQNRSHKIKERRRRDHKLRIPKAEVYPLKEDKLDTKGWFILIKWKTYHQLNDN